MGGAGDVLSKQKEPMSSKNTCAVQGHSITSHHDGVSDVREGYRPACVEIASEK